MHRNQKLPLKQIIMKHPPPIAGHLDRHLNLRHHLRRRRSQQRRQINLVHRVMHLMMESSMLFRRSRGWLYLIIRRLRLWRNRGSVVYIVFQYLLHTTWSTCQLVASKSLAKSV